MNWAEKAILNLVPKCVEKPRSAKLIDILANIIVKVKNALKSSIAELIIQFGMSSAKKLSQIAQKWGYKTANEWALDMRYLTIVRLNNPLTVDWTVRNGLRM